jgi:hypothetical protein
MALELKCRVKEASLIRKRAENLERKLTSVIGSMEQMVAAIPLTNANINTSAKGVRNVDMEKWNAKSMRQCEEVGRRPQYLRYNIFHDDDMASRSCAEWTEIAKPLAPVPASEFNNYLVVDTINRYPHLFTVSTPILVDNFERLLAQHPNTAFVASVVNGFHSSFWPWADTRFGDYPDMLDESLGDPTEEKELSFIRDQCDKEILTGRFSESFGTDLLPGTYSMPIHAVPKLHSTNLQLVTNHSAGDYSLNSMIKREDIIGYPLDNMTHLGEMLLRKRNLFYSNQIFQMPTGIFPCTRYGKLNKSI